MSIARELDELIEYEVADKAIPSISYAVFDAKGVLAKRHISRTGEVGDDSFFRIGSISKTFAAMAAMQLVERGGLLLDADISTYLPGFGPANPWGEGKVTLRRLLSHRAGLVREAADGHYLDDCDAPLAKTVAGLGRSTLKLKPDGSSYAYSNAGYAVVGAAIEAAGGRRYADYLRTTIFEPLGLKQIAIAITPAIRERLAPAVMWSADTEFPASVFDLGCAPAGNIFATLDELTRYGQMLLRGGEGVIGAASLEQMWRPAGDDPAKGYGFGFAVDMLDGWRSVGHGGVVYGYASTLQVLPEAGLGVIVFSTLDFTNEVIGRLARRALRLALAGRGKGSQPGPARRLAPPGAGLAVELAGVYASGAQGLVLELRAQGERLTLIEDGLPLEIRPVSEGRFLLDGRIHGEETSHPDPIVEVRKGQLIWKGQQWQRVSPRPKEPVPDALQPYLGDYGPEVMAARLSMSGRRLLCLMEHFCPHVCEPLGEDRYRMRGSLYENEVLRIGVVDEGGRPAIRVGEMTLARREV